MTATTFPLWLLQTDPAEFSFAQLSEQPKVVWDGVTNPVARQNLRRIKVQDRLFIYHAGAENCMVGTAVCVKSFYSDPHDKDPHQVVIDLQAEQPLARPVSLDEIRKIPELADWELLRQPRLSVVPVSARVRRALSALIP